MIKFLLKAWANLKHCLASINADDRLYEFPYRNPEVPENRPPSPAPPSKFRTRKVDLQEQFWTRVYEESLAAGCDVEEATVKADESLDIYNKRFKVRG